MATIRFKVTVRRICTGCDFHMTLFAKNADQAMERAKDRARVSEQIAMSKYLDLLKAGIAVFRVVSCEVDPNQTRPIA